MVTKPNNKFSFKSVIDTEFNLNNLSEDKLKDFGHVLGLTWDIAYYVGGCAAGHPLDTDINIYLEKVLKEDDYYWNKQKNLKEKLSF